VIGTLINTGVNAQRAGTAAPDATPLSLPKAVQIGNEFTKTGEATRSQCRQHHRRFVPKVAEGKTKQKGDDDGDDDSNDLFRRFSAAQAVAAIHRRPSGASSPARASSWIRTATS